MVWSPAIRSPVAGKANRHRRAAACCVIALMTMLCPLSSMGDSTAPGAQPLEFRHEEAAAPGKAVLGLAFVAVLAALGWGGVQYLRRSGRVPAPSSAQGVKVLQFKRLSARLSIVTVNIDDRQTVIFADNGHSLLLLSSRSATRLTGEATAAVEKKA